MPFLYRVETRIEGLYSQGRVFDLSPGEQIQLPEETAEKLVQTGALARIVRPEDREITPEFLDELLEKVKLHETGFNSYEFLNPQQRQRIIGTLLPAIKKRIQS